ncbi:MAG TPA: hypothetical protein VJB09_01360 [Candidatus Paceibacterota bacterium]
MYKKILNSLFVLLLLISFLAPVAQINAQVKEDETKLLDEEGKSLYGLVPCGNKVEPITTDEHGKQSGGTILNPCNFDYAILMINKIVNFLLFVLFVPLAAIVFCYAGFLLLFSGGDTGKMKKAKDIFWSVVVGLLWAMGAWLVIHTISDILGYKGSWIGF